MTDQQILDCQDDGAPVVSVGETPVSMKVVQSIYNEITGKTEKLTKGFTGNHEANFSDIKQLHIKIVQLLEQYNVIANNCAITLYHLDDCKEQFSSFERFDLYDQSSASPVENVHLEYSFMFALPNTKKIQPYKISVNVTSRVAMRKRASTESGLPAAVFRMFSRRTADAEIEYVDYTVARNFLVAIDHWFAGLRKNKPSKVFEFLKKYSSHFGALFKVVTAAVITFVLYRNHATFLAPQAELKELLGAAILLMGGAYVALLVAGKLGTFCERAVDAYQDVSGLRLNRGDDDAIAEYAQENTASIRKSIVYVVVAVSLNILAAWIASLLGVSG